MPGDWPLDMRPTLLTVKQRAKMLHLWNTGTDKTQLMERFGLTSRQFDSQLQRARNPQKYGAKKRKLREAQVDVKMDDNMRGAAMVESMPPAQYAAWRKANRPGFDGIKFNAKMIEQFMETAL